LRAAVYLYGRSGIMVDYFFYFLFIPQGFPGVGLLNFPLRVIRI